MVVFNKTQLPTTKPINHLHLYSTIKSPHLKSPSHQSTKKSFLYSQSCILSSKKKPLLATSFLNFRCAAMASSAMFKLFCVGMMALLVLAPHAEAAIGCGTAISKLSPCLSYFSGNSGITTRCCYGVKSLLGLAKTTSDRQSVCGCLKGLAIANPSYIPKAGAVLSTCGVSLPYRLSPGIDCSKVK